MNLSYAVGQFYRQIVNHQIVNYKILDIKTTWNNEVWCLVIQSIIKGFDTVGLTWFFLKTVKFLQQLPNKLLLDEIIIIPDSQVVRSDFNVYNL